MRNFDLYLYAVKDNGKDDGLTISEYFDLVDGDGNIATQVAYWRSWEWLKDWLSIRYDGVTKEQIAEKEIEPQEVMYTKPRLADIEQLIEDVQLELVNHLCDHAEYSLKPISQYEIDVLNKALDEIKEQYADHKLIFEIDPQ